ncbi:hypothetical protein KY289_020010 [Solanum tuberosum]|nr:hypothetical protein KY289_020010 [Solanum tuberosum]
MASMIVTNDTRPMGRQEVIEEEEVSLLMVSQSSKQYHKSLWYLDTGCSNHLSGEKSAFSELDETFRTTVKFGDDSCIAVKGKGKCGSTSRERLRGVYQAWDLQDPRFYSWIDR